MKKRYQNIGKLDIVLVYKRGNNKECSTYRRVTSLSDQLKDCEQIVDKKITRVVESTPLEAKAGVCKITYFQ